MVIKNVSEQSELAIYIAFIILHCVKKCFMIVCLQVRPFVAFKKSGRLFQILGSKYCIFVCGLFLAKVDLV